ncbi:hypothetical protein ACV3PA_04675 [Exiguobacterium acetylicum]
MRKIIMALLGGIIFFGGALPVAAEVTLPLTGSFGLSGQFQIVKGQERVWEWSSYQQLSLIDLQNGERIQSLSGRESSIEGFDVSDDQTRRVVVKQGVLHVYNAFGTKVQEISMIIDNENKFSEFVDVQFIPNTHTVVLLAKNGGNAKLLSYDLDAEQLISSRGTSPYGQLLTARDHVAVVYSSTVYLYTSDLTYTGVIHAREEDGIEAFDMNDEGLLIIGEQGVPQLDVYDLNHGLEKTQTSEQFVMGSDVFYSDIAIDESGAFIAVTSSGSDRPFSLFERKTGQRIYTSLDQNQDFSYQSGVELSNEAHSIIVEGANQTNIYSGKELSKRPIAIQIPKARQRINRGASETLALEVTRADGKTVLVKSGVTWETDHPETAFIQSGKLYGEAEGDYTLTATYEGFTATVTSKVVPPKLSSLKDIPWLERHRQSLLDHQSFEGLPVLSSSYSKLKGTKGKMLIPKEKMNMNGKWKGSVLALRYPRPLERQPNQIELLTMLPALEQRSISKKEIQAVFGKPVTSTTYAPSISYQFSKSNKAFAKYTIKRADRYRLNDLSVDVYFDKKDIARFITVSKQPSEKGKRTTLP